MYRCEPYKNFARRVVDVALSLFFFWGGGGVGVGVQLFLSQSPLLASATCMDFLGVHERLDLDCCKAAIKILYIFANSQQMFSSSHLCACHGSAMAGPCRGGETWQRDGRAREGKHGSAMAGPGRGNMAARWQGQGGETW